jgi:hypothetical protein
MKAESAQTTHPQIIDLLDESGMLLHKIDDHILSTIDEYRGMFHGIVNDGQISIFESDDQINSEESSLMLRKEVLLYLTLSNKDVIDGEIDLCNDEDLVGRLCSKMSDVFSLLSIATSM